MAVITFGAGRAAIFICTFIYTWFIAAIPIQPLIKKLAIGFGVLYLCVRLYHEDHGYEFAAFFAGW